MKPEEVALHNCEREPVHSPNRIQTFAALLAYDIETLEIHYVSENLAEIFPCSVSELLGKSFLDVSENRDLIHEIRNATGLPTIETQRERVGEFFLGGQLVDVGVYVTEGTVVVEFEPVVETHRHTQTPVSRIRSLLGRLETQGDVEMLLQSATKALRYLTGFDRVMGYRFMHDAAGEVIAESRSPSVDPFLGLRYPATDIPGPVRSLMLRVPFRVISDIHDPHAAVQSNIDKPLDLSQAHSRGISPIHIEYLNNMGVCSTMNTSIVIHGQLWGLFAFHHYRPVRLTPDQRSIVETLGHFVSLQIQQKLEQVQITRAKRVASTLNGIRASEVRDSKVLFQRFSDDFLELTKSAGAALVTGDSLLKRNRTPCERVVTVICQSDEEVLATNNLATLDGISNKEIVLDEDIAGVLSLRLDEAGESHLCFFRPEIIEEVHWGGRPEKKIEYGPNGPRLHPRGSFEIYRESVSGRSTPWSKSDIKTALEIRAVFQELSSSGGEVENFKQQADHRDILIAELNHRVRNILALVRSVARQTKDSSESLEAYATAFEKRIVALSAAHDLIGSSGLQWARLSELVNTELEPYLLDGSASIEAGGDAIALKSDAAPLMSLVIHELTTNAVKYGALSERGGRIDVNWRKESGGLMFRWRETLSSPVKKPKRYGFGLSLIERAIPFECKGECRIDFQPDGLNVEFWLPSVAIKVLDVIADSREQEPERLTPSLVHTSAARGALGHAIVVEDNVVLAMELERQLYQFGFKSVRAFRDQSSCMAEATSFEADFAILDINLGGSTSFELAKQLLDRHIPVVFASGYGDGFTIPVELTSIPRLTKPVDGEKLRVLIDKVLKH